MAELKTEFWASALIRRAEIGGAFAGVVRKGDADAGAVLVKVATLDGRARLYRAGARRRRRAGLARPVGGVAWR